MFDIIKLCANKWQLSIKKNSIKKWLQWTIENTNNYAYNQIFRDGSNFDIRGWSAVE